MPVLSKGEEITCPSCGKVMVRALRDIERGGRVLTEDFEPVEHHIKSGDRMTCPYDGTKYFRGQVHTKEGWK